MGFGWALGFHAEEGWTELAFARPSYGDRESAHAAVLDSLRLTVEGGFPFPELLVGIVFDESGGIHQTLSTRRLASNN